MASSAQWSQGSDFSGGSCRPFPPLSSRASVQGGPGDLQDFSDLTESDSEPLLLHSVNQRVPEMSLGSRAGGECSGKSAEQFADLLSNQDRSGVDFPCFQCLHRNFGGNLGEAKQGLFLARGESGFVMFQGRFVPLQLVCQILVCASDSRRVRLSWRASR